MRRAAARARASASTADARARRARPTRRRAAAWDGLERWRARELDARRAWGDANEPTTTTRERARARDDAPRTLAAYARKIVATASPREKARLSHAAYGALVRGEIDVADGDATEMPTRPARPARPRLVPPREVPSPKNSPLSPAAHAMHTVTHIELNAIDLAWDTVGRFAELRGALPDQFFVDFAHVADDESRHLLWCLQRLEELGAAYGDVAAHDVLWEGAEATRDDPLARLAVVPCMQEARGLDAGPRLVERLIGHGDARSAAIVARISEEEIGHVAVGVEWFRTVCAALDDDADDARADDVAAATFRAYIQRLAPDALRGPFNHGDRARAGIDPSWYADAADAPRDVAVQRRLFAFDDPSAAAALRARLRHVVALETGAVDR